MRGEEDESMLSERRSRRIFVGGLGSRVTEDDMRSTFGAGFLGRIDSVQIVRTKGRTTFAYFDFFPSSINSLSKLFSMYNGCMWKGGRLKLEKAKEHYLLRLKQERSENAELANNAVNNAAKSTDSLEKLTKVMNPKTPEIRLFFPKLRKLKPLPFRGTGKHKYSFQRIEVPALPIHFCDCDEHSKPLYIERENMLFVHEAQDGGIDKKELTIMESVMNKLFQREDKLKPDSSCHGLVNGKENAPLPVDDNEEDNNVNKDNDNLVMNMVAMGNARNSSLKSLRYETKLDNERALVNGLQIFKAKVLDNEQMSRRTKTLPAEKKRKSPNAEPADDKVAWISTKVHPNDSARETEKLSAAKKTKVDSSLLKLRENNLKHGISRPVFIDEGEAATVPFDDTAVYENEADDMTEEDDNLVLNMAGGGNIREQTILYNKGAVTSGILASKGKRKLPLTESNHSKADSINIKGKKITRKVRSHELTQASVATPIRKTNAGLDRKPKKGTLWAQKSSWTNLVGGRDSSFSISQLLPDIKFV